MMTTRLLLLATLALGASTLHACAHNQAATARTQDASLGPCMPQQAPPPPSGEGMWPWTSLQDLDPETLAARGLQVPLSDLWTPGQGGLLSAVAGLEGCSASFVSPDGLMLTNHHCVYQSLQRNSSQEQDLIRDGFVAGSRAEELDGKGLRAHVFKRHTDVTARVLGAVPEGASDLERAHRIEEAEKAIVAECEATPNTRCRVAAYNDGLSYVLLETTELRDVRLVLAPPSGLADFGGEIDNWHWPRHGMDFALIRAYTAPDGTPAAYSPDNVPYHPERFLPPSTTGVQAGQLVMVAGTPGRTRRYLTSAEVEDAQNWYYPTRVDLFEHWIATLEQTCSDLPDSCLATAARRKSLNNSLTNARGTLEGLQRAHVLDRKLSEESAWRDWIAENPAREKKYGQTLDNLLRFVQESRAGRDRDLLLRYALWGAHTLRSAWTITKWVREQEKPDAERELGFQERDRARIEADLVAVQGSIHPEADRRVLAMFLLRLGNLPVDEHIPALDKLLNHDYSPEAINRTLEQLYQNTILFNPDDRLELFHSTLDTLKQSDDAFIQLALQLTPTVETMRDKHRARAGALSRLRPPYLQSLIEMRGAQFYPDANGTPRVTFGTVAGYQPRDGIWYLPFTNLQGLVAKHTGLPPFDAPESVRQAATHPGDRYRSRQAGGIPLCFLSNCDTTGGNSGSPAIDGQGRLVGLNFDRVYENIVGDFGYNPRLSRNIMVDIRGILWYLDRVVGADHLLEELGIQPDPRP